MKIKWKICKPLLYLIQIVNKIKKKSAYFMCLSRCMKRCLWRWVRNLGFWVARGSNWFMLTRPSSGRTVSTHTRQMLSRQDVTNMLETDPLQQNSNGSHVSLMLYDYNWVRMTLQHQYTPFTMWMNNSCTAVHNTTLNITFFYRFFIVVLHILPLQ